MNVLVFWNELSERPLAATDFLAKERMDALVDALAALVRAEPSSAAPRLRSDAPLDGVELAPGYTVGRWRVQADQARRMIWVKLATSSPLLRPTEDKAAAIDRFGCADCTFEGRPAVGLRAAWSAEELATSLGTDERWTTHRLAVVIDQLDEQGVIFSADDFVRHLSAPSHVAQHLPWLTERARTSVVDGRDLWRRRAELFPNLEFCREVEGQVSSLDVGSDSFRQMVRRLFELQKAFSVWDGRPIHPAFLPSKCTPETPQTLKEEAEDHSATSENGDRRIFSWHVRFTPGSGRIFFEGLAGSRRGLVGYVGSKKGGKLT